MQTINSTTSNVNTNTARPIPTMGDVRALKARVAQLGRDTTDEITAITGAILTLAHTTPTDDPIAMSRALVEIAQLGVQVSESWQDMLRLAEVDKLTDMCEAVLALGGAEV